MKLSKEPPELNKPDLESVTTRELTDRGIRITSPAV
jgi:hypothetical protein